MAQHNELGQLGEQLAANFLQANGYNILARNWRVNRVEIDILAELNDTLIFVESSREKRLVRVFQTRGWSQEELDRREDTQLPLDKKRKKADYVITNGDELQAVKCQIENVLTDIQSKQFNKN